MKIAVDFIRAEQHWRPDTGEQQNYLVFGFAHKEHRIPCSESDIIEAVRASQDFAARTEDTQALFEESLRNAVEEDRKENPEIYEQEFGGDFEPKKASTPVVNPPVMFAPVQQPKVEPGKTNEQLRLEAIAASMGDRPRTRATIKADKLARMREKAKAPPAGRVALDEMGNPSGPGVGAVPPPAERSNDDDDLFPQG